MNYPVLAKKTGIYFAVGGGAGTLLCLSGRTWGRDGDVLQNESKTGILLTRHFSGIAPEPIILPPDTLLYPGGKKWLKSELHCKSAPCKSGPAESSARFGIRTLQKGRFWPFLHTFSGMEFRRGHPVVRADTSRRFGQHDVSLWKQVRVAMAKTTRREPFSDLFRSVQLLTL